MPRITYKDWVGKQARVLLRLVSKDESIVYDPGSLVDIVAYDRYMRFSINDSSTKRYLWGVEPRKIKLLGGTPTIREKILSCVTQANVTDKTWLSATQIARLIDESPASVSSILPLLHGTGLLDTATGKGPRGGLGYSTNQSLIVPSRYDRMLADRDLTDPEPHR